MRGARLDTLRAKSPLEQTEQGIVAAVLGGCYRDLSLQLAALQSRTHRDAVAEARVSGQLAGVQRVAKMLVTDKTAFLRYENAKSA